MTLPLQEIKFLVPGLIPFGYVTFVGAREGVGKTTLLTALAYQMTRPEERGMFLGESVPQGPVAYLNSDAADGESRSVRYWLKQHHSTFTDGDPSQVLVFETTGIGISPEELGELLTLVQDRSVQCVIIDSFMSTFPGINSNKLDQAMRPMLALRDFAALSKVAVIVADHLPKTQAGEREGDRGIMGSTGKSAQARAVLLMSQIPPKEVEGREVLRQEVRKASFARSGYALGIEVLRQEDEQGNVVGVALNLCDLPNENVQDTRGGRATAAVMARLESSQGEFIPHADLVALAIKSSDLGERTAQDAVRRALGRLGNTVEVIKEAKRGGPKTYRLRTTPESDCQIAGDAPEGVRDDVSLVAEESCLKSPTATKKATEEVLGKW